MVAFVQNVYRVIVTPWGVNQDGADALGDGGLDGHENAKESSIS